ncbi:MAG: Ig-like domain-containing protein [Candidatus Edwardsbacteria bacterium]|nr:Ig-like domain-containing protein [Candidatus Edwardsbacteria bacterium]
MKRILFFITIGLLSAAGLLLQCGKKGNPMAPPVSTPTPPKITAAHPANGAAGLACNTLIYVVFDRPMNHGATNGALTVEKMTGSKTWSNYILIFKPDSLFKASDTVRFTISADAQDNNGTALEAAASYWFICGTDADTVRPAIVACAPTGASVPVTSIITASFNKKLAPWSDAAIKLTQAGAPVSGNSGLQSDSILVFVPAGLAYSKTYRVTMDTTAVDRCGNHLADTIDWSFTTMADTVKPFVTRSEPAAGDSNISVNAPVKIHFSEPMDTVSARRALSSTPVLNTRAAWSSDTMIILTMIDTLSFHTNHQVTVGTGAMDKNGNHLVAAYQFDFTTMRGLYVACNAAGEVRLFQLNDLRPEGSLPSTTGITQVRMARIPGFACLLTNNGLHFRLFQNHNIEPFFTSLGAGCYGIAVSPGGVWIAVSDTMRNYVYLIDTETGQLIDTFATIGAAPKGLAFSADSRYLYVLCQFNNRVEVYDRNSPAAAPIVISMPNGGEEMASTPTGDRVFAACGTGVSVIRTSDNTVAYDITGVSNHPYGLAVSPDGLHLAVSCFDEGTVKVYALANYALAATVSVGTRPKGLCYSPDGKYLYVANSGSSSFTPVSRSGATYNAATPVTVGAGPWGIAITP